MKYMPFIAALLLSASLTAGAPATKEILTGRFTPADNEYFTRIDSRYTDKTNIYMQRDAYDAYLAMRADAAREGIDLTIISATRNFDSQRAIWQRKWNRHSCSDTTRVRQIMRYSSMPGTSRHHWGTDVDFISVENDYWTHGAGLKTYQWLVANAKRYGFYQPYDADPTRTGYAEERWHWSYYPTSALYTQEYMRSIKPCDITGFDGSHLVGPLDIILTHVSGVALPPSDDEK